MLGNGCFSTFSNSQINEFHSLHRELVPYVAWVKSLDLPSNSKSIFSRSSSSNKQALDKARSLVQIYLDRILNDDQLNQSEIVYAFLSPSPRHLKSYNHLSPSVKKNFAPFSNFFRSESSSGNRTTTTIKRQLEVTAGGGFLTNRSGPAE